MPVALVTGASRGVGRGVAIGLVRSGFKVYVTGRTIESADLPREIVGIRCDHADDAQTRAAVQSVLEHGGVEHSDDLDLLVTSAWGGYERMVEGGQFTWGRPFWKQPMHRWSSMMDVGVRSAFTAAACAVP